MLKFTRHFQARMIERNIEVDHVRKAINSPDSDYTDSKIDDTIVATKKIDKERTIEVVYSNENFRGVRNQLIITAYYLDI